MTLVPIMRAAIALPAHRALLVVPIDFDEACAFVEAHHRHHAPPRGHKFSVAVAHDHVMCGAVRYEHAAICGVAIIGRPVSRHLQDSWTLEVTRCATDGTRNACSALYRAAWRAARALGWRRLITYTLPEEGGASLRGAGFTLIGERGGGNWNRPSRPRIDTDELLRGQKVLWEMAA